MFDVWPRKPGRVVVLPELWQLAGAAARRRLLRLRRSRRVARDLPVCRGENPPGMKFCRNCGERARARAGAPNWRWRSQGAPGHGRWRTHGLWRRRHGRRRACGSAADGSRRRWQRRRWAPPPMMAPPPMAPAANAPPMPRDAAPAWSGRLPAGSIKPPPPAAAAGNDHVPALRHADAGRLRVLPAVRPAHAGVAADRSRRDRARRAGPSYAAAARRRRRSAAGAAIGARMRSAGRRRSPPTDARSPRAAPERALRPATAGWGTAVLVNRDGSDGQRFPLAGEYWSSAAPAPTSRSTRIASSRASTRGSSAPATAA